MRNGRRSAMAKRRVIWRAEDGLPLTSTGWRQHHESFSAEDGIWEEVNGVPALKFIPPNNDSAYRFFLPDTFCSQAAIELDFTLNGMSSNVYYPTISAVLPGETTSFYHGIIVAMNNMVSTANVNNKPTQTNLLIRQGTRIKLRLERRGEQAWTLVNGVDKYQHTTPTANAQRSTLLSHFPADAPDECCLMLAKPPTTIVLTIWLHNVIWEEL